MEPNIVLVYRFETHRYLTLQDLIHTNKWESFEINHSDDFETFNHKERHAVEGRGLCVNQDGLNKMVEEINKQIQKYCHLQVQGNQYGSVHIVTSESAAGTLKSDLERPNTVIGFPDSFSIGPLWMLHEKKGQSFRKEWLLENINLWNDDYEYENKITNALREIEDIAEHVPIYIWYGNNPSEQTGLRFFLYLLREKMNNIFLVNSTELYKKNSATKERSIFFTSQINSEDLKVLSENIKEIKSVPDNKRIQFHKEWERLSETKDVLRLWIDDEIKGVKEDHYDSLILETMEMLHCEQGTKDFIKTGSVIGEIVLQKDGYIDYFFLEYRIRHLIYSGVLELKGIPKSVWNYSIKLR